MYETRVRLQLPNAEGRGVPMGAWGSNLQECWSIISQSARGLAIVLSQTIFFSKNLITIVGNWSKCPPPTEGVSAHHWAQK